MDYERLFPGVVRAFAVSVTVSVAASTIVLPRAADAAPAPVRTEAASEGVKARTWNPFVVYGSDDRRDLYAETDKRILALASSTVALIDAKDVEVRGNAARIHQESYQKAFNLCSEEPFVEQGIAAFCSGSLVAPDVIMTAGHCVPNQNACDSVRFVFGFGVRNKGRLPDLIPANDVYRCAEIIASSDEEGTDFALIRLDRKVPKRRPLPTRKTGAVSVGDPLLVIGHPNGLPTKIADGARVRTVTKTTFDANLDTYGGNSGSPVFNMKTGLIEGILVQGEQDMVYKNGCYVSNVCPDDGCRGETVTKVGVALTKMPRATRR